MSKLEELLREFPSTTKLVAVSKTKPAEEIQKLYDEGQRVFGENKVQEILAKKDLLPSDIEWHLIGHLQTNKVKHILPYVSMIHSVDSLKLLFEIEKNAANLNIQIDVLLQMHIAEEESKFGLDKNELIEILEYYSSSEKPLKHIRIRGLMGMATNTDNETKIRNEFKNLKGLFDFVKNTYLLNKKDFTELSMGMSSDYKIAIEEGSTFIRIGSLLFGSRNYI